MSFISNHLGRGALQAVVGAFCIGAASMAAAQVPKVLIIGDAHVAGTYLSQPYADGAYNEMVAAVTALGGSAADVTQKNFDITGASGNPTTVTASDFIPASGGQYDIVVLTAVFGGFNPASVSAVQSAIQTRAANAFFLYPDQCSACTANIDQITNPIINAATGWNISTGTLFNNSSLTTTPGSVVLNGATPLASSFNSLNPMAVYDYRALNNVPAYNVLYMPPQTPSPGDPSPRPPITMPTPADVANNTRINNVSALIVPRAQSFSGNGACIFTISDVNPLTLPGNPPVGRLGSIMVNAATSPTGSCAAQSGSIEISKTLAPIPAQAPVVWPLNFQFTVTCDKPSAGTNYAVPPLAFSAAGTQTTTVTDIPAGANCSVSEQAPTAISGFRWEIAPAAPINVAITEGAQSSAAFTNTLVPTTGSIAITKTLAPLPAGAPVTWPQNFNFTATCNLPSAGSTYAATASFNAAGSQTATIVNVPEGAVCSLSETQPAAPAAHAWDTAAFSPASVTVAAGQTVSSAITNRLQTIPPALGTALITKTLAPLPAGAPVAWPLTFNFTATCDKPVANTPYTTSLSFTAAGSQTATLATIPAGSNCTLSEALPAAPSGYTWDAPAFAPATISVAGGQSVSTAITNTLRTNAVPAGAAPVPGNTAAGLAAMAVLLAALGIRQRRSIARPLRSDKNQL